MTRNTRGVAGWLLAALFAGLHLTGCANISASHEYYKARPEAKLELPPGLTRPMEDTSMSIPEVGEGTAVYSSYAKECASGEKPVLPEQKQFTIMRDGQAMWLVVNAAPDKLWPWAEEFWQSKGFGLSQNSPKLGIMETDWYEYRESGDTAPTRDRYRLRMERGVKPETTELYLTLRSQVKRTDDKDWQPRPEDAEQRIEMIKRLAYSLGAAEVEFVEPQATPAAAVASTAPTVETIDGALTLTLSGDIERNWPKLIQAMEAEGAVIDTQERRNRFLIASFEAATAEKKPSAGWLNNVLAPSAKHAASRYRFELSEEAGKTRIYLLDLQSKPVRNERAQKVIDSLHQRLRAMFPEQ
ncbi:MAG: outer membrane protein assembly factor BamC [Pseudomonadota bacterium]